MRRPGLDIFQTFNEVGLAVKRATGEAQRPGSRRRRSKATSIRPRPPQRPLRRRRPPPTRSLDHHPRQPDGRLVRRSLRRFPASQYAAEAKARLDELKTCPICRRRAAGEPGRRSRRRAGRSHGPRRSRQRRGRPTGTCGGRAAQPLSGGLFLDGRRHGCRGLAAQGHDPARRRTVPRTGVTFDRTSIAVTADREGSLHVIDALTLEPARQDRALRL